MTVYVRFFAHLRSVLGPGIDLPLPAGATVADLRRELAVRSPHLTPLLDHSAIAINHDFAEDAHPLSPGDEVAVIPPVSGG
jgi:molybdopterin converting factor subunit 1